MMAEGLPRDRLGCLITTAAQRQATVDPLPQAGAPLILPSRAPITINRNVLTTAVRQSACNRVLRRRK